MKQQFFPREIKGHFNLRCPKSERPTPIYFVVRIDGKQCKIPIGAKIYPNHWNAKKQEAYISANLTEQDNKNNFIVNNKISHFRVAFDEFQEYICSDSNSGRNFKRLNEMLIGKQKEKEMSVFTYLKKCIEDDIVVDGAKKRYRECICKFEEFVNATKKDITSFNDITKEVIIEYQTYLRNLTNLKRTSDGKLSTNQINRLIRNLLQKLDKYAVRNDKMDKTVLDRAKMYPKLRSKVEPGENRISLRDDEVYKLFHYKCDNQSDEDIKNLFLLECTTGQRVSDISKIDSNINNACGVTTIQLKQKKCGSVIDVPLIFKMAKDILASYPNGLPKVQDYKINKRIKIIAKKADVGTEEETVSRQSGDDTNAVSTTVHRYDLITNHVGRITFITMLKLRGWDSRKIKDFSGHKDISMVEHYSKTTASQWEHFKRTNKEHPEMILEMIGEEKPQTPPSVTGGISIDANFIDTIRKEAVELYKKEEAEKALRQDIEHLKGCMAVERQHAEVEAHTRKEFEQAMKDGISYGDFIEMHEDDDENGIYDVEAFGDF